MSENWAETNFLNPHGGGQGGDLTPWWRDSLDFQRSMWRRTPDAMYPDGYLGTIRSRREDRLLDHLKSRQNQRAYQRGVHKGERIDPGDYVWPEAWQPDRGLQTQAMGLRQTTVPALPERRQPNDSQMLPRGVTSLVTLNRTPRAVDPARVHKLRRLLPDWR